MTQSTHSHRSPLDHVHPTSFISLPTPPSMSVVTPPITDLMPQLGSANISIPVSPGAITQIHGSLNSELVASPPVSSKDFNHLIQLSV